MLGFRGLHGEERGRERRHHTCRHGVCEARRRALHLNGCPRTSRRQATCMYRDGSTKRSEEKESAWKRQAAQSGILSRLSSGPGPRRPGRRRVMKRALAPEAVSILIPRLPGMVFAHYYTVRQDSALVTFGLLFECLISCKLCDTTSVPGGEGDGVGVGAGDAKQVDPITLHLPRLAALMTPSSNSPPCGVHLITSTTHRESSEPADGENEKHEESITTRDGRCSGACNRL